MCASLHHATPHHAAPSAQLIMFMCFLCDRTFKHVVLKIKKTKEKVISKRKEANKEKKENRKITKRKSSCAHQKERLGERRHIRHLRHTSAVTQGLFVDTLPMEALEQKCEWGQQQKKKYVCVFVCQCVCVSVYVWVGGWREEVEGGGLKRMLFFDG